MYLKNCFGHFFEPALIFAYIVNPVNKVRQFCYRGPARLQSDLCSTAWVIFSKCCYGFVPLTCSPNWSPFIGLPPVPSLWVIPVHQPQASSIVHWTWTGDLFHTWYYTCFNAILPNHPTLSLSHRVQRLFYTSVSLLLSRTQGYCYHLSKFHIYVLVYCIGVFLSGVLHSV